MRCQRCCRIMWYWCGMWLFGKNPGVICCGCSGGNHRLGASRLFWAIRKGRLTLRVGDAFRICECIVTWMNLTCMELVLWGWCLFVRMMVVFGGSWFSSCIIHRVWVSVPHPCSGHCREKTYHGGGSGSRSAPASAMHSSVHSMNTALWTGCAVLGLLYYVCIIVQKLTRNHLIFRVGLPKTWSDHPKHHSNAPLCGEAFLKQLGLLLINKKEKITHFAQEK